jgi:hypothetical protein
MSIASDTPNKEEETKTVGGSIPVSLYWEFKKAQAERKDSATTALEIAIRLYIDVKPTEEE